MKRTIAIVLSLLFSMTLFAQSAKPFRGPMSKDDPPKVEKMVSNLTAMQKKRIESITEKSKKEVSKLKNELESVRTQICGLHAKEGDQSATLFPLFDRESELMAEISKEMYRCRLQIDEVLTPEQLKEFRNSLEAERKKQIKNKQPRMRLDEKHKISVKNNTEKE